QRMGYQARKNGYILVATDWANGSDGPYGYTSEEHLRVLDTIRDVRQHYNVDADRVFLSGWGEGANACWDIALSHPDMFAGAVPISSQPKLSYCQPYLPNAMNLPFYVVTGDLAGDAPKTIMRLTQDGIAAGYPMLTVFYGGRG